MKRFHGSHRGLIRALKTIFVLVIVAFAGLNLVYVALNLVALRQIAREAANQRLAGLAGYGAGLEPGISIIVGTP